MDDNKITLGGGAGRSRNEGGSQAGDISQEKHTHQENLKSDEPKETAKDYGIPKEFLDSEFKVPTEVVNLPSKGAFYPNRKGTVTIKYLTAEEDDILFSQDLIKSGKVLNVLLDKSVIDRDLRPDDMISGDRNFLLIEMRKTGLGSDYRPGEMQCSSCGDSHNPIINLDLLKAKTLEVEPNDDGEYNVVLPLMKMNISFRLLTGADEKRLLKLSEGKKGSVGGIKVKKLITEKYLMQIMEVNGNRDKTHIKKFIAAMPMKDSMFFREYLSRIEPGIDLSYDFECPNCGHLETKNAPITHKLFYPDLED